jgi:hypothetical protein
MNLCNVIEEIQSQHAKIRDSIAAKVADAIQDTLGQESNAFSKRHVEKKIWLLERIPEIYAEF